MATVAGFRLGWFDGLANPTKHQHLMSYERAIKHSQADNKSSFSAESIDGYTIRVEQRDHGKADLVLVDDVEGTIERRFPLMGDDVGLVRALLTRAEQGAALASS